MAIVVEANDVQMEFAAPGMDIVGFEHEAETARQKKTVEAALADLKEPLKLFVLPEATGCTVTSVDVKLIAGEHEHLQAAQNADKTAETDEHEGGHSEFRATYALACTDASLLRFIHFAFFERFRDAEELGITIIDANGETTAEVSRQAPSLEN
ncbi:ZrgA family zinc uptake protein [Mesorhizobium sp. ASY16-5R]|uniref:ZrgA family zinc uptake protein n=1 Tax=Mesorhizobium sp. ASY16-5R TaxID=3445772 RepID=UPI003FA0E54D